MAERILLIAGGFALLISAIAFGIDGQPLTCLLYTSDAADE